ncbi:Failed axon connections homolog [Mytilus edulis]|uniref:Failed axon connections homolog n=1 Tax=Mytilus edulis TaxID=6550 RepID=A0A8S3VLP8_MYTED|nr:Failed axon connections homolog [Mytilus edulis]
MDINNLSENLSNIILDSANKTFNFRPFKGKRKKKKGKQKWFNGNCKFFKRELNNLGSRLQQHPNNHDLKTSYHQLRREYKKLLKDTKKKFITDIIDKLDSLHEDNPKLFWKTINNLKKNTNREENPIPLSEMSNYLKKLYEENNTDLDISKIEIENINNKHLDYAFICKEVRDGIKKLKKNKQPGIDLIYNEFLLYGKDLLLLPIVNLFNRILSSGKFPDAWNLSLQERNMAMESDEVLFLAKASGTVLISSVVLYVAWKKIRCKSPKKDHPRDTVILHQFDRGPYAPSMTPYAIKVETYLRMAKIPYKNEHGFTPSKKGKWPWIEYNGEEIADSEFCIEYLNDKLGIDLDKDFTVKERGIARAFQKMLEENTYWAFVLDRWVYDENWTSCKVMKIPSLTGYFIRRQMKKMAFAHGMGRHNPNEVYHIMELDFKALSNFLGNKKFLLGDKPCQADCSVFGLLSNAYWQSFGTPVESTIKRYENLCYYCQRMKETFWPDWDECITHGNTKEATK